MMQWCGTCRYKNSCGGDRFMECTVKPFQLWEPATDTNVGHNLEAKADAGMSSETFERLMEEQIERSRAVLCHKAKEYATGDRLHNFRVAAALQGCDPIQALSGMMAKHTVSVYDMCESGKAYPIDLWQEKITDSINYLLILNAMVREGS